MCNKDQIFRFNKDLNTREKIIKCQKNFFHNVNLLSYIWIKIKTFFNFSLNSWEKLYMKSESESYLVINLKTILRGLQEIEKIKAIIFTKEQLNIFNILPNPVISLEENKECDFFNLITKSGAREIDFDSLKLKDAREYMEVKQKKIA